MRATDERWEAPIYGELGVLAVEEDGQHVRCHACGRAYRFLAMHARQAHALTAAEYRSLFGLNAATALAAPAFLARKRVLAERTIGPYWGRARELLHLAPEQRRAYAQQRRLQPEAKRNPRNRAIWDASMRRAREAQRELLQDPSYRARLAARISVARGGRVSLPCAVCGGSVAVMPHIARRGRAVTCGPTCLQAFRRRLSQEVHARTDVQMRLRLASRRTWPPVNQLLTASLEQLTPTDRDLLCRFYGLPDARDGCTRIPASLDELARAFGLSKRHVSARLRASVAEVLRPAAPVGAGYGAGR